jgi:hypothetical protein
VIRPIGTPEQERERRECERNLIGRGVSLSGRDWAIRVVDHLHGTADLVDQWQVCGEIRQPLTLKNVPLEDVAVLVGCSCGQHLVSEANPSVGLGVERLFEGLGPEASRG